VSIKKRLVPESTENKPFSENVLSFIYPTSTEELLSAATTVSSVTAANL
jgi:hypothetical protein